MFLKSHWALASMSSYASMLVRGGRSFRTTGRTEPFLVVKQPYEDRPVYVVRNQSGHENVVHRSHIKHCPWLPDRHADGSTSSEESSSSDPSSENSESTPRGYITVVKLPGDGDSTDTPPFPDGISETTVQALNDDQKQPAAIALGNSPEQVVPSTSRSGGSTDTSIPRRYPVRTTRGKLPDRFSL